MRIHKLEEYKRDDEDDEGDCFGFPILYDEHGNVHEIRPLFEDFHEVFCNRN